jgi:hypothetical protein
MVLSTSYDIIAHIQVPEENLGSVFKAQSQKQKVVLPPLESCPDHLEGASTNKRYGLLANEQIGQAD